MREIVLDTETTGMEPAEGDRLIEIGCVELDGHAPTGRVFHHYLNPERDVPAEATAVHGITAEFLKDKPVFSQVFADFLEFVGDAPLIIHNADFDMKFINAELKKVGHGGIPAKQVVDTLAMARRKFPGSPASLDALCRRYDIDLSGRELHGALLDAQLLAEVYIELLGGRQRGLGLDAQEASSGGSAAAPLVSLQAVKEKKARAPRPHAAGADERAAHAEMVGKLTDPIWAGKE